jgi:signal transduction histidine kinase
VSAAEDVLDTAALGDRRVHATLEPAVISGDSVLAGRLITDLVNNAIRYNIPGGDIWISTRTTPPSRRRPGRRYHLPATRSASATIPGRTVHQAAGNRVGQPPMQQR